jgi:hypothetical protein
MFTHFIPRLLSMLLSWIQAGNLRTRMYEQRQHIELLETALEDIARISASRASSSERHRLILNIIANLKKR